MSQKKARSDFKYKKKSHRQVNQKFALQLYVHYSMEECSRAYVLNDVKISPGQIRSFQQSED